MENYIVPWDPQKKPSTIKRALPYFLILLVLLLAGAWYLEKNRPVKTLVNNITSPAPEKTTSIDFNDYGQAPEFTGIQKWLNTNALTMAGLKGKVVLVDFWTYSCINCIRTLPHVRKLYDTYKDKGLVVVGVHTPEFDFEKDTANVENAIKRFGINYPVAQDNNYKTWEAYSNKYWPAKYLINQEGKIVYMHFGEGNYDVTEKAVQELLKLSPADQKEVTAESPEFMKIRSPEMYFGTYRLENLVGSQSPTSKNYKIPTNLPLNTFALEGSWQFDGEKAVLVTNSGKIKLRFSAGKVHIVAQSKKPNPIKIIIDGKTQNPITIDVSKLYTLFDSTDYSEHVLEIEILQAGFEAFTFTFG